MSMFVWLALGFIAYVSGFSIRHFWYNKKDVQADKRWQFTGLFFVFALAVFALINFWVLHKPSLDVAFIGVSSLVATGIFYYGISTDTTKTMNLPD